MMINLSNEVINVQNPALGAFIIWSFVRGYYSFDSSCTPFPVLFIVLPIIYRNDMVEVLHATNRSSGLRYFANKFLTTKVLKNDMVSQIHVSSSNLKELTLDSIKIALNASLIAIDYKSALVFPLTNTEHKSEPKSTIKLGKASEKLGYWCAQLTIHEISQVLKVRF